MNALVYVDIDQGIHKGKNESFSKSKTKKTTLVFFLYKYRKFLSISSEFKLERKSFILEVCGHICCTYLYSAMNYLSILSMCGPDKVSNGLAIYITFYIHYSNLFVVL